MIIYLQVDISFDEMDSIIVEKSNEIKTHILKGGYRTVEKNF